MHSKASEELETLKRSGTEVQERLVEFPMWDEYGEQIKSDMADLKNLGPADAIRFIQSYTHGCGDYTKERKQWLDEDFDTVMAGIKDRRKKKSR